jgi:hypothetical protein
MSFETVRLGRKVRGRQCHAGAENRGVVEVSWGAWELFFIFVEETQRLLPCAVK